MSPLAKDAGLWTRRERFDSSMDYVPLGERFGALTGLLLQLPSKGMQVQILPTASGCMNPMCKTRVSKTRDGGSNPSAPTCSLMVKRPITGGSGPPVRGSNPRETMAESYKYSRPSLKGNQVGLSLPVWPDGDAHFLYVHAFAVEWAIWCAHLIRNQAPVKRNAGSNPAHGVTMK